MFHREPKKEELLPWQVKALQKKQPQEPFEPSESASAVHAKEVHVSKQKQLQKEVFMVEKLAYKLIGRGLRGVIINSNYIEFVILFENNWNMAYSLILTKRHHFLVFLFL